MFFSIITIDSLSMSSVCRYSSAVSPSSRISINSIIVSLFFSLNSTCSGFFLESAWKFAASWQNCSFILYRSGHCSYSTSECMKSHVKIERKSSGGTYRRTSVLRPRAALDSSRVSAFALAQCLVQGHGLACLRGRGCD